MKFEKNYVETGEDSCDWNVTNPVIEASYVTLKELNEGVVEAGSHGYKPISISSNRGLYDVFFFFDRSRFS